MAANKRVYYAVQKVGVAPLGSTTYTSIRGLQSCGANTTFNLEQVFEMGQLAIYENVEGIPNIELTMQKVLDGYAPIFTLVTQSATAATLIARANANPCAVVLGIYSDQLNSASGNAVAAVTMSGMYVSSVAYNINVDGNATEDVTLVGNNKVWSGTNPTINDTTGSTGGTLTNGNDQPMAITGSGGVQRREDLRLGYMQSQLPTEIPGVGMSGFVMANADGSFPIHLRKISLSANMQRDDIFELGRKGNYYRSVKLPIEVTAEIGIIAVSGDMINALEEGSFSEGGSCGRYNLTNQLILIRMCEGLIVDLGNTNKLQSVGYNGGGADGSNLEITYSYRNFNTFAVYHPQDPNAATVTFQHG